MSAKILSLSHPHEVIWVRVIIESLRGHWTPCCYVDLMTLVIPAVMTKFPETWCYLFWTLYSVYRVLAIMTLNPTRFLMFSKIADKCEAVCWLCDEAADALLPKTWLLRIKYLLPIDLKCRRRFCGNNESKLPVSQKTSIIMTLVIPVLTHLQLSSFSDAFDELKNCLATTIATLDLYSFLLRRVSSISQLMRSHDCGSVWVVQFVQWCRCWCRPSMTDRCVQKCVSPLTAPKGDVSVHYTPVLTSSIGYCLFFSVCFELEDAEKEFSSWGRMWPPPLFHLILKHQVLLNLTGLCVRLGPSIYRLHFLSHFLCMFLCYNVIWISAECKIQRWLILTNNFLFYL